MKYSLILAIALLSGCDQPSNSTPSEVTPRAINVLQPVVTGLYSLDFGTVYKFHDGAVTCYMTKGSSSGDEALSCIQDLVP